jgi:hypothetical protein
LVPPPSHHLKEIVDALIQSHHHMRACVAHGTRMADGLPPPLQAGNVSCHRHDSITSGSVAQD